MSGFPRQNCECLNIFLKERLHKANNPNKGIVLLATNPGES